MKVTWVEEPEITDQDDNKALVEFEKNLSEWESKAEILGALVVEAIREFDEAEIISEEPVEEKEEVSPVLVDIEPVVPKVIIDITLVGTLLRRSVQNTTQNVWRKCYPGAFWIRDGKRLADPTTKSQCMGDIRPGMTYPFVVVVPIFPPDGKPDALVVAILEDGVGWHTVEELRVR